MPKKYVWIIFHFLSSRGQFISESHFVFADSHFVFVKSSSNSVHKWSFAHASHLCQRDALSLILFRLNSRAVSEGRGVNEEDTRYTSRGVDPTKSAASGLMFNSTTSRNANHTVNIEVSRVVNSDMAGSKYRDDFDSVRNQLIKYRSPSC
jgi:hypothetical protein